MVMQQLLNQCYQKTEEYVFLVIANITIDKL
jgi:hypothetical protein